MSTLQQSASKKRRAGISWPVIGFALAVVIGLLAWRGWGYYFLSLNDKFEHPDYRALRPSGSLGYLYGLIGTLLIFANLLYLARRKLARNSLGSMRTWLDLHVFTGLTGSVLILFHSAFQVRSDMAKLTASSLAVVVITGLVGRFLFALSPSRSRDPLDEAIEALELDAPGVGPHVRSAIDAFAPADASATPSLFEAIGSLRRGRKVARDRREAVELVVYNFVDVDSLSALERKQLERSCRDVARVASGEVRAVAVGVFLRLWRWVHRFFAVLMLLAVGFHIWVAWHYGYRWIFSE